MRPYLSIRICLFFILMLGESFTALGRSKDKKDVIKDPHKYVLMDLQCYITENFPNVNEFGVLKKKYLPQRIKKNGMACSKVRFIDLDKERGTEAQLNYVLDITPLKQVGELYEINIPCYKLHVVANQVELMQTSVMTYTFEKRAGYFLLKEASRPLPRDFK
ncbi:MULTISPECIES: hypothetical protein [unclassified Chitinophaga]|uniref:hypothetical protein n=1 Tax=unclassified Chitinophaga TaxID=2619133 RepID=UPI0030101499